jgi:GntR family transcriptional regulator / MocR family aminotransferase
MPGTRRPNRRQHGGSCVLSNDVQDEWATWGKDLHLSVSRPGVRVSLERALRSAVQDGRLRPGIRLPSSRSLARDLNVARNTVADVYEQLSAEGWLTARRGSGTSVSAQSRSSGSTPAGSAADAPAGRAAADPQPLAFDFTPGMPNVVAFPRSAWLSATRTALANAPHDALSYGDVRGRPELREALAEYLGRARAVRTESDGIVVCSGTIHGFSMLCAVLRQRGAKVVAFEAFGWAGLVAAAAAQGLQPVTIGVDEAGARVDELYATQADAVLLTPSHQFPLGHVLSAERRRAVATWARSTGGLVIEDDYDGEFRYDRQPVGSLQELAPDCVAYLGTTSKSLAPGIRLAWVVPPVDLVDAVTAVKRSTVWQTGVVEQLALAEFVRSGGYDRHIRRSRLNYRRRRDRLMAARDRFAPDVRIAGVAAGLHAVLEVPARVHRPGLEDDLVTRAASKGLTLKGLSIYQLDAAEPQPAIVVGYGTPADNAFEPALEILFDTLATH